MASDRAPRPMARRVSRRAPWWLWTLGAIVVVIAGVAALGGFADVPISRVPTIAVGATFHGSQVDSRVTGATVSADSPIGTDSAGGEWLIVSVVSTNRTNQPVPADAIGLRVIAGGVVTADQKPYLEVLQRDGAGVADLQPGLRTALDFLWKVPAGGLADGDPIVTGVFERLPQPDNPIFSDAYSNPVVKARLQFAIGDRS